MVSRPPRSCARVAIPVLIACIAGALAPTSVAESSFRRGDANGDGRLDIADPISTLDYLFGDPAAPECLDALDANDSGQLDIADPIFALDHLFAQGPPPPAPGPDACGPDPTPDDLSCNSSTACPQEPSFDPRRAGHLLDRIAYGPAEADLARVREQGIRGFLEGQLDPASIDESTNAALLSREDALFREVRPAAEGRLIMGGSLWRYRKGTEAPPADWTRIALEDSGWLLGPAGIGYGDGDDATVLADMQGAYTSVYARKRFRVADPGAIGELILRIDYDDGFVAYLNGTEVARRNVAGTPPAHTATASPGREAGTPEEFDITAHKGRLVAGENLLAIQVHNQSRASSDLSLIPELVDRTPLPGPALRVIDGLDALQALPHVRGVYARRQLQAVLAEFWDNHFTTDFDKVAEHLDSLQNSDASDALSRAQAEAEAAQLEYLEDAFFHEHALGRFGDLLLASATSPAQLIYLDNVLNVKGKANENYAREILELFACGADNRYTQKDIEELARCFTGWTICKVAPGQEKPFPDSARQPPAACGVEFRDTIVLDLGPSWRYAKGTAEPAPAADGSPTIAWTAIEFDDGGWTPGSTGIGYGDGDDATVLSDMRGNYVSVYLRRRFEVADPYAFRNLILEVGYDDGFVAYLNGIEVGRSETMDGRGSPPRFDALTDGDHEVTEGPARINLSRFMEILRPGTNVLAIQVHNGSLSSSDLSVLPRILDREVLPGGVEPGLPFGSWIFRFDPAQHDTGSKTLFRGTPQEIVIPAGRAGADGVRDAIDVIDALAGHPSTAEFISIKLIQRFVSDEISLPTYHAGTAPAALRSLVDAAVRAWSSTSPPGDIGRVLRAILDPEGLAGPFWSDLAYRAKVRTPVEFINASLRALDADASGAGLGAYNDRMGMHLFTRDEPDGWSELGTDWIDTASMLERISFVRDLAGNGGAAAWNPAGYLDARGLETPEEIIEYFDGLLFHGTLSEADRGLLLRFLQTDGDGAPAPLDRGRPDYEARIQAFAALLLSMPHWHFQ